MNVQSAASLATNTSSADDMRSLQILSMARALDQVELVGEQLAEMIQMTEVLPPADGSTINILA